MAWPIGNLPTKDLPLYSRHWNFSGSGDSTEPEDPGLVLSGRPQTHIFGWSSIFFFRLFFILHGYVRWWPGSSPSCLFKKHPWKWRKPWGHAGAGMEHEKGCGCFHRSGAFWLCFVLYPEAGWHKLVDLTPKLWVKPSSRCQRWLPCQCPNTASSLSRHILLCWELQLRENWIPESAGRGQFERQISCKGHWWCSLVSHKTFQLLASYKKRVGTKSQFLKGELCVYLLSSAPAKLLCSDDDSQTAFCCILYEVGFSICNNHWVILFLGTGLFHNKGKESPIILASEEITPLNIPRIL